MVISDDSLFIPLPHIPHPINLSRIQVKKFRFPSFAHTFPSSSTTTTTTHYIHAHTGGRLYSPDVLLLFLPPPLPLTPHDFEEPSLGPQTPCLPALQLPLPP